jgi:NADH dehydrogenase [ubiquinone] 1 alpha subcomplex assembly factor 6
MDSDLSLCGEEIRKTDHDQFICGLFVPDELRNAFYALQVFNAETQRIRDLVQEPHLGLFRLQWWRDVVDALYEGKSSQVENGTHKEIVDVIANTDIPKPLFERYFNARAFDMEDHAHDDMAALLRYAEATGGTIAELKTTAIEVVATEAHIKIGIAQTLYDIIRSLAFQARKGRCKLPQALIKKHGLDLKTFMELKADESLKACVQDLVSEITNQLEQARNINAKPDGVLLSSIAIEDYLKRLKKVDYDPFNPNIGNGRLKKQLTIAFRAWRGKY